MIDNICLAADQIFENGDQIIDGNILVPAEVDDLVTQGLEPKNGAAGNIIHISEAARLAAVAIQMHFLAFGDPFGKAEHDHVRTASRTVDGEIAKYDGQSFKAGTRIKLSSNYGLLSFLSMGLVRFGSIFQAFETTFSFFGFFVIISPFFFRKPC